MSTLLLTWGKADETELYEILSGAVPQDMAPEGHQHISFKEGQSVNVSDLFLSQSPHEYKTAILVAMGNGPYKVLQQQGWAPKNRAVTSMRGKLLRHPSFNGLNILVTFAPGLKYTDSTATMNIMWDVHLAARFLHTGSLKPKIGKYEYAEHLYYVIKYVKAEYARTGKPVDVAVDTEDMNLFPWYEDKEIVTTSWTAKAGYSEVIYHYGNQPSMKAEFGHLPRLLWEQIHWLLTTPIVRTVFSNGKHDLVWIAEKWGIECKNFGFDTMLAGNLLNENDSNSLNWSAKCRTSMGGYDDEFDEKYKKFVKGKPCKAHMELIPKDEILVYTGGDTDASYRVAQSVEAELNEDPALRTFYDLILHPGARAFEKVERRGVDIDVAAYKELAEQIKEEVTLLLAQCQKHRPAQHIAKHGEVCKFTPAVLRDLFFSAEHGWGLKPSMFTEKKGEASTAIEHLRKYAQNKHAKAFLESYERIGAAEKTISTFIEGFLEDLRPDGKFHPVYLLFHGDHFGDSDSGGSRTGRTSAKHPAIQLIPSKTKYAERIRKCYRAPEGRLMFHLDYMQGELKIAACLANEPTMIEAYRGGADLHCLTAARIAHMDFADFMALQNNDPKKFKLFRSYAKPANFGLIYGVSPKGYQEYAWRSYQIALSDEEAMEHRKAFFSLYPELLTWHQTYRELAHQFGYVRSPLGRVRHLPLIHSYVDEVRAQAERQAINSPVQSTLTDMTMWTMADWERDFAHYAEELLHITIMTHDSLEGHIQDSVSGRLALKALAQVMQNRPFHLIDWEPQLPFTVEADLGPSLGELEKFDLAA